MNSQKTYRPSGFDEAVGIEMWDGRTLDLSDLRAESEALREAVRQLRQAAETVVLVRELGPLEFSTKAAIDILAHALATAVDPDAEAAASPAHEDHADHRCPTCGSTGPALGYVVVTNPGFYVISGEALAEFLRRAHEGEDPDLLLVELYANSDVERVEGEGA